MSHLTLMLVVVFIHHTITAIEIENGKIRLVKWIIDATKDSELCTVRN